MRGILWRAALAAALVVAIPNAAVAATAAAEKTTTKTKTVTMKGEIVDPQCWIQHDGRGLAHAGCATACAKAGQTLAFLDDKSGTLYQLLAENHSSNPNEKWYGVIGKPVIVRGDVMARGGMNAIVLRSVVVDREAKPRP
jgi:type 1 fimbria pilin